MMPLGAMNVVAVLAFAAVYVIGARRWLSEAGFVAAMAIVFVAFTGAWVRVEAAQHAGLDAVQRIGRTAFVGVAVAAGTIVAILLPLFWLEDRLPPEAGIGRASARTMAVVLFALVHLALLHVAAGAVVVAAALVRRLRGRRAA
jgi:hypothetical protein